MALWMKLGSVLELYPPPWNTRVSFTQTFVTNVAGSAKLPTDANTDEACGDDGNTRAIKAVALSIRSATEPSITLTVKHKQDFNVVVGLKDQPSANFPTLQYTTIGAKTAHNNLTERGATDAAVKLTFPCSDSGLASITEAAVVGTMNDHSLTGKTESLFSGEFYRALNTDSSTVSVSEGTKVEGDPKKRFEKLQSSEITPSLESLIVKPVSLDEKMAARKRPIPNAVGSTKQESEEASSNLKGLLYRHPCLPSDLDGSPCNGLSTAEERAKNEGAVHTGRWKLQSKHHFKEAETRHRALKDLQRAMSAAKIFTSVAQENRTIIDAFEASLEANLEGGHESPIPMAEFAEKRSEISFG
ncbi:unnamed protein product [Rhizoctonia solani]|uniref:Uncharacterized protein n=1 Tax=Rhizoctonia solani TaxID=456999 RepID=A0A8H2WEE1_9AGAM|nr:unnamed protein product [Rhizoctonia solani]